MSRLFFYLAILSLFLSIRHVRSAHINPTTTIIACDLDEVVISGREASYMHWLMAPSRLSFAMTVKKVRKRYKLYDPLLIIEKIKQLYPKLSKKAEEFKKIIGLAPLKKKTVALLGLVAQQGYTFVAASNMAKGTYGTLVQNQVLPEIFSPEIYFVKTKKSNKKADGSYYEKPDLEYFINLKKYIQKKYPDKRFEHIVFIDDKEKNVKVAREAGLIAIHYKNSQQLRESLVQIGIIV